MKWLFRTFAALTLVSLAVAAYVFSTATYPAHRVGFQLRQTPDLDGRVINIGIWYPSADRTRPTTLIGPQLLSVAPDGAVDGQHLPLVVLSHGNGGGLASHTDLAMDLASAGYVVAAVMHPGDNSLDQRSAGSPSLFSDRARQISRTLDYLLAEWPERERLDPQRVGAFGFSAGAFTVLTLIGAQPDFNVLPAHCKKTPEFICQVLQQVNSPLIRGETDAVGTFDHDSRIRAAVLAAPGLGFAFPASQLSTVSAPVQLWSGDADQTVPTASNAQQIRDGLPGEVEWHAVPGARHFSFLAPCGLLKPAALCDDSPDFDRSDFHRQMNSQVISFFDRQWGQNRAQ